ncbi:MAG: alpha/beta fold hydrolase [Actinomycetes bacterium]
MIAWEESGAGEPVVFVHGITEDRRAWDPVVPLLADRFRCLRLDLRGHGESPPAEDYSALAMASDIAEVVQAAGAGVPPLLVGHSLGAIVATAYATAAPVRGVVNVDQSLRLGDFARGLQPLAPMLQGPGFPDAISAIFASLGVDRLPERERAYVDAQHVSARRDVVLGVWDQVLTSTPEELTTIAEALASSVTVPYLAIHGCDPGPGYQQWLTGLLPSATVELWVGDGHYPHLVEPERFAARVTAFAGA